MEKKQTRGLILRAFAVLTLGSKDFTTPKHPADTIAPENFLAFQISFETIISSLSRQCDDIEV